MLFRSQRLLPTQEASEELGEIALAKGDKNTARSYFEQVAAGGGKAGERAKARLAQIQ